MVRADHSADEVAFWRDASSANPDTEIISTLRPGMETVPDAVLLGISSPYARRDAFWGAYRRLLLWTAP